MQLPLFYIYKVIKHKRKIQSNHNRKFQCPFSFCAKGYNHKNKMLAHLHTHVPILYLIYIQYGIKPFECSYCSKSFNEKGNLKTHLRIHTGERPYHCDKCPKAFKAFGQLRDHLTSHTGIKPFQCPICLKFYRRKGILKNHILIHQVIVPQVYPCIYCCNTSEDSTQLDQHIMSHLTNSCSDATTGDSTSQYSFSEGYKNEDMFTMLQKDMTRKEEVFYFDLKEDEELERFFLID